MIFSTRYPVAANVLAALALLAGMVALTMLGRRRGARYLAVATGEPAGLTQVDSTLYALFGLLMALTFYGAVDRFQARRELIVQEAQAIGTAYLRMDLLPEPTRAEAQARFRAYVQLRLAAYAEMTDFESFETRARAAENEGAAIWSLAADACRAPGSTVPATVVLPPINAMLDIALARKGALRAHPPGVIYTLLYMIALVCAYLSGFAMARSPRVSWTHVIGFAVISVVLIFVICDMELPRRGLIRVDDADRMLRDALASMR